MCRLDQSNAKTAFSKLSKDDSVLSEERETEEYFDEKYCIDNVDETDAVSQKAKAPAGKRFARSVSMPAKDMRSMVKLAEEKERKSKTGVDFFIEKEHEDDVSTKFVETNEDLNPAFHDKIPVLEKGSGKDLPDGNGPGAKLDKSLHPQKTKKSKLDSIEEDIQEEEKKEVAGNPVEATAKEEGKGETMLTNIVQMRLPQLRANFNPTFHRTRNISSDIFFQSV
jgi:hypothetical protein